MALALETPPKSQLLPQPARRSDHFLHPTQIAVPVISSRTAVFSSASLLFFANVGDLTTSGTMILILWSGFEVMIFWNAQISTGNQGVRACILYFLTRCTQDPLTLVLKEYNVHIPTKKSRQRQIYRLLPPVKSGRENFVGSPRKINHRDFVV